MSRRRSLSYLSCTLISLLRFLSRKSSLTISSKRGAEHLASSHNIWSLRKISSTESISTGSTFDQSAGTLRWVKLGDLTTWTRGSILLFSNELCVILGMESLCRRWSTSAALRWGYHHLVLVFWIVRWLPRGETFLFLGWSDTSATCVVSGAGWFGFLMNIRSGLRMHLHIAFESLTRSTFLQGLRAHLMHLSGHLLLCLSFRHALVNEDIHEQDLLLVWVHSISLILGNLGHTMSIRLWWLLYHALSWFRNYSSLMLDLSSIRSFSASLHVSFLGSWSTVASHSRSSCGYGQVLRVVDIWRMLSLLGSFNFLIRILLYLRIDLCVTIGSRLVAIVDDEGWLVHIQVCRCSGIVQVVAISLGVLWVTSIVLLFHSLLALIYRIGRILKCLLYYFLIRLRLLLIYHTLFLDLLVFGEQFLLQVLVLCLVFIWSKMSICADDIARGTLELVFHLKICSWAWTHGSNLLILFLKLLELLLYLHLTVILNALSTLWLWGMLAIGSWCHRLCILLLLVIIVLLLVSVIAT